MKIFSAPNVSALVAIGIGGALNYFGSSPRILYLCAVILCVWILFQTHTYVSFKEKQISDKKDQDAQVLAALQAEEALKTASPAPKQSATINTTNQSGGTNIGIQNNRGK